MDVIDKLNRIKFCQNTELFKNDIDEAIEEIKSLRKFKECFDELYGQGLEVANWHLNGILESFDSFYEEAVREMEIKNEET